MQPNLFETIDAPPLEPISDTKPLLAKPTAIEQVSTIIESRSNSVSSSSTNSLSNSNSNTTSTQSSVSLTAQSSFSHLSLQNINISDTNTPMNQDIITAQQNIKTEYTNDTLTFNCDTSNTRRKSSRIAKKRKQPGYVTLYTDQQINLAITAKDLYNQSQLNGTVYEPPRKRQKTYSTYVPKSPKKTKPKTTNTGVKTPHQSLTAQNRKMQKIHSSVKSARKHWIHYHYSAFEPFLSNRSRRYLRPKGKNTLRIIDTKDYDTQPEILKGGTLRDYQLYSLNWLRNLRNNGIPAILADEMGLGKTIQSIAVIAALLTDKKTLNGQNKDSPSLIICPLSVSEAWLSEFNKWLPQVKCVLFHGKKTEREQMMSRKLVFGAFDICITTYETATNNKVFLNKFYWNYLIIDEAHKIKNEKTNWHNSLKMINNKCLYSVLLTGTPIQNNMRELWALLSFMFGSDVFDIESADIFDSAYQSGKQSQNKELLGKAPYLLNPFFLRRLKCEVELSLPPKEEIIIKIRMSVEQKKYYKTFLLAHSSLIDQVSDVMYGGDKNKAKTQVSVWKKLRHLYTELRKIAMHPFLLQDFQHKISIGNAAEIISHSSKLQLLDKLLHRLKTEGHRVLLFSCFTLVLDLLQVYCEFKGYKYLRLDGSTSRIRRKIDIMRFNDNPDSEYFIYLISNRAGGLGINLQSADTVIHFDTDWNPQADLQAQARAHRIGQKRMVKIYRLITKDTVEERILFRSQQKLYLDAVVNKGAKMLQDGDEEEKFDLENEDLLSSIKFGAQKMFDNDDTANDEIDLDVLLERDTHVIKSVDNDINSEREQRNKLLTDLSLQNNVRDFNFKQKLLAGNVFEGKTYEKKAYDISDGIDYSLKKREGKKARVKEIVVDGLKFRTRIEENPMSKFYDQCSTYIYDSKNTIPFIHELTMCWGCDKAYTPEELENMSEDIIKCQNCPKTFHNTTQCWRGERTKMGVMICSQHSCHACGNKTSDCGMILRCLGCQLSFCYDCSPQPYWKDKRNIANKKDGLHFKDVCEVAQHYRFYLSQSQYMYCLCSNQCKTFYDLVYCKRALPDLSLKYRDLPNEPFKLRKLVKKACKDAWNGKCCKAQMLKEIKVDSRIRTLDMPNTLCDRLRQTMGTDCALMEKFYDILYLFPVSDYDVEYNVGDEIKSDKEYILGKHYMRISELNDFANDSLTLPQWKQCTQCKQWRTIPIKINAIYNGKWMRDAYYTQWVCTAKDGLSECCESAQEMPTKQNKSEFGIEILKLQRQAMEKQYRIRTSNGDMNGLRSELKSIQMQMYRCINKFKKESMTKLSILSDRHMSEARMIGIGEWKGFICDKSEQNSKDKICAFYEHLISQFRHWRIGSLKTLMDHLGFFVKTKKKVRKSKEFRVEPIALSYQKHKVITALATFLIYPNNEYLVLTTKYFSK